LLLLGWATHSACSSTDVTFHCQSSDQCTQGAKVGRCEATGLCSFLDPTCASGHRYGHLSGAARADACTECGNGRVDPGEECDTAAKDTSGSCLPTCRFNRCGDGFVRTGIEECDDGNTKDGDGCSAQCLSCAGDNALLIPETGHCYTRHDQPATFADAASACQANGSYLVTYTSGVEINTVIDRLLRPTTTSSWIGLYDAAKDEQFVWITSEPTNVTSLALWDTGQPDPLMTMLDCAAQDAAGKAHQLDCSTALGYVCEDQGFIIRPEDNHAYRAFFPGGSFDVGQSTCQKLGGHLAIIDDAEEQMFIASQFAAPLRIGAKVDITGPRFWIDGKPMTYQNFAPGEPDGRDGPCVIIGIDHVWRDRNCDGETAFMCEVE
jgi:cysteine-rich repeat protein